VRRTDWVTRMWATVEMYRCVPFEWGVHDCCLLSARTLDSIHDTQFEQAILACYQDQKTGEALIASYGSLEATVTHFLGEPQKMALTKRGQVCLLSTSAGDGIGVCVGSQIAVASPRVGVAFYAFKHAQKSWPDP